MNTPDATPLLLGRDIHYSYGAISALRGVSLRVNRGEAVCVIGPNGAGKTTLARLLSGLYRPARGEVLINGEPLPRQPHQACGRGVGSVLEGRRLFAEQSVRVNLQLGCYRSGVSAAVVEERLQEVTALFPALQARLEQRTSTMSGGEQQMVAIGRALMGTPQVLILDEPSMGLAPKVTGQVFDALARLLQRGMSILLVEQNAPLAFELAARGYLIRQGEVVVEGPVQELMADDAVRAAYLGA